MPTPEEISLLQGIDVRIAERGGVKVIGVPIGTDEYAMDRAMEIVRNGGSVQLSRMLPRISDKQSANLIATGSMVQRAAYIERVMDPELSLPARQRQTVARCGCWKACLTSLERQKNRRSSRTGARRIE